MKTNPVKSSRSPSIRSLLKHVSGAFVGLAAACFLAGSPAWAATRTWTNSITDINWSTAINWSANVVPGPTDVAQFGTLGAATTPGDVTCTVPGDTSVQRLYFNNTNGIYSHHIKIADGATLSFTNTTSGYAIWTHAADNAVTPDNTVLTNIISGANSAIAINTLSAPGAYVGVYAGGTGVNEILDLSGLGTFSAYLVRFYVAPTGAGTSGLNRESGLVKLARTNLIYSSYAGAGGFIIGSNNNDPAPGGTVELGQTNAFFANSVQVGVKRANDSRIYFAPGLVNPSVYFRNREGSRTDTWWIGNAQEVSAGSGDIAKGTLDFSGGTIDALVNQVVLGRSANSTAYLTGGRGYLTFTAGSINANTIISGDTMQDYNAPAVSVVNVGGTAELIVNTLYQLGNFKAPYAFGPENASSAILNIGTVGGGGGSVKVTGSIQTTRDPANTDSSSEIHIVGGGSLYVGGNVGPLNTLEINHSTLSLDSTAAVTMMGPVCTTINLRTTTGSTLSVQGSGWIPGQFPLIQYQTIASGNGFSDLTCTKPDTVQGYFSNNVANSSIDLVVTNVLITTWTGQTNGVNNGDWDIGTTTNWKDQKGAASAYSQTSATGNAVIFDDSAPGATTVNLTSSGLSPVSINMTNSSLDYTFSGTGGLTGVTSLTKEGSKSLTLANTGVNNFTGPILLAGGALRLSGSANRLPTNTVVTLADVAGVALELNNLDQAVGGLAGGGANGGEVNIGSATLTLGGRDATFAGVIRGTGKLVQANAGLSGTQVLTGDNTYTGGTTISGATTLIVANPSGSGLGTGNVSIENGAVLKVGNGAAGSIAAAAITNNGTLHLNPSSPDMTLTAVISGSGTINKDNTGLIRLPGANTFTGPVNINNGQFRLSHPGALGTTAGATTVMAGTTCRLELEGDITVAEPIFIGSKAVTDSPSLLNLSGTNILTGPFTFASGGTLCWDIRSEAGKLSIRGPISNVGGANKTIYLTGLGDGEFLSGIPSTGGANPIYLNGSGTWTFAGLNSYGGQTFVNAGTLVVNGRIGSAGECQVASGATLAGTGTFVGPVTISGTLSPGAAPGETGSLIINSNLTLLSGCTSVFDVSDSGSDSIGGLTNVTYSGKLQIALHGTVSANRVFPLFSAASYSGAFEQIELPTLAAPFSWDTNYLALDGTLRVVGGPETTAFGLTADHNFQLSGTGTAGQAYRILCTTNMAQALSAWLQVGSGNFSAGGAFSFTDLQATNHPQRFYRVVSP